MAREVVHQGATPVEEMMRALDDQVRAGKVLYLGISDAPAWVVARANALAEQRGWTPSRQPPRWLNWSASVLTVAWVAAVVWRFEALR